MNTRQSIPVASLISNSDAVLVDMDGCMIASGQVLPGAADLILLCAEKLWLVSNNSSHSASELSSYLEGLGLIIPAHRILLAGELVLTELLQQFPSTPTMILARKELRQYATWKGITESDSTPGVIVLTRDLDLDYHRLSLAIKHLSRGIPLLVANPDLSHPDLEGDPVPETGSLLALILAAIPDIQYQVFGKPEPGLFLAALKQSGAQAANCVMIGDNPRTDCDGAASLGIRPLLIGKHENALAQNIEALLKIRISY
jgi:HAD superfamily hydrolase (TIGR01450 family)